MHPVMAEMLAAERIREMVAWGDGARRARQAREARRGRAARRAGTASTSQPGTQTGLPLPQPEAGRVPSSPAGQRSLAGSGSASKSR